MDGNDSLKRIQRRKAPPVDPGDGAPVIGQPNERKDERTVAPGYYITREQVDLWSRELVLEWIKEHENDADIVRFFLMVGRLFFDSSHPAKRG